MAKAKVDVKETKKTEIKETQKAEPKAEVKAFVKPADIGRNDPCYCGSGKKYKKCHWLQDEEAERKLSLQKAEIEKSQQPEKAPEKTAHEKHDNHNNYAPVRQNTNAAAKTLFRRKIGDG